MSPLLVAFLIAAAPLLGGSLSQNDSCFGVSKPHVHEYYVKWNLYVERPSYSAPSSDKYGRGTMTSDLVYRYTIEKEAHEAWFTKDEMMEWFMNAPLYDEERAFDKGGKVCDVEIFKVEKQDLDKWIKNREATKKFGDPKHFLGQGYLRIKPGTAGTDTTKERK